jgi:hypothetical protein
MNRKIVQTDYKNRQEYVLEYEIDEKTQMVKNLKMTKKLAWYWGIDEEPSVIWNIDLSNLPVIRINTYIEINEKPREVSEIQLKLNNLQKYPFYFTKEIEDYLVEYQVKELIAEILEDIDTNIVLYGLLKDVYRNR